jgi:group II intron reverse transcriptase/maturase
VDTLAERVEGRRPAKGNTLQTTTPRTQSRTGVSRGLQGVREAARRNRRARFTALLHHVTPELLHRSFYALKRQAAPGVDRMTWAEYEEGLADRLSNLHERVHRGSYRATPSRRVYITKADGGQRPLGVASLEDKIVQQAVVTVLNSVYEIDFLGFSYGFRPQRGSHNALDALWVGLMTRKVNWVLDVDIRGFFDTIDHGWLRRFLEHRIADRRVLRLVHKWLRAGFLEDGRVETSKVGTPQGAVASPLLANVYLHYVFDLWVQQWRRHTARGEVIVVRYADDIVLGFQHRQDAIDCLEALHRRMNAFGLALHPGKTRLLEFGRFAASHRKARGEGRPETFDFLGFTHSCGQTRSGKFMVCRRTQSRRLAAKLKDLKAALARRRHLPIPAQGAWLRAVVRGYCNYHAVPGNIHRIAAFCREAGRLWHRSLKRRSQRHRLPWRRFAPIVRRWLPPARILHPYPNVRFDATHPRQEPGAVVPHAGICAGGAG